MNMWSQIEEYHLLLFICDSSGKESACQCRRHKRCQFNSWVGKIPWRRAWEFTPVFLPGESHGQKSLAGYSPRGLQRVEHDWSDLACTHMCYITALWVGGYWYLFSCWMILSETWVLSTCLFITLSVWAFDLRLLPHLYLNNCCSSKAESIGEKPHQLVTVFLIKIFLNLFLKNISVFIYLAALGLNCGIPDLLCVMHIFNCVTWMDSLAMAHGLSSSLAYGFYFPHQGLNPPPCSARQIFNPWTIFTLNRIQMPPRNISCLLL